MMAAPELDISSPMSKCQCTLPHQCSKFCPLRTLLWFPNLLTCLISLHVISCFPEWNCTFEGTVFRTDLKFSQFWLVLPAVAAETLDPLHELGRGLLWREQEWPV